MRPKAAYIWSSVTLHIAATLAFEGFYANMFADPAAGKRAYDPNNPSDAELTGDPKGYDPFEGRIPGGEKGGRPHFNSSQMVTLTDKSGDALAVVGKGSAWGSDIPSAAIHTGAITKNFPGSGIRTLVPQGTFGTLYGTCQQVTNATLFTGGISNTVAGLYPGWSTYVSTFVYGNYGGGLVRSVYTGAKARDEY